MALRNKDREDTQRRQGAAPLERVTTFVYDANAPLSDGTDPWLGVTRFLVPPAAAGWRRKSRDPGTKDRVPRKPKSNLPVHPQKTRSRRSRRR
jgi:hypothetical protein